MKCPVCGNEMNSSKCLRCGYVCKDLTMSGGSGEQDEKEEGRDETVDIDPDQVILDGRRVTRQSARGSVFDDVFGGGIFGGLGSIVGSLFGDIFGMADDEDDGEDDYGRDVMYEEKPKYYDDFGSEIPFDVYGDDFVELKDIEILDEDGNPVPGSKKQSRQQRREEKRRNRRDEK